MKQLIRRLSRVADTSSQYEQLRCGEERGRGRAVPEGHVPLSVGEEMERFAVRAELLGHPILLELLRRSAQEYGYGQRGVIRIPCPTGVFERLLRHLLDSGGRQLDAEVLRFLGDGC